MVKFEDYLIEQFDSSANGNASVATEITIFRAGTRVLASIFDDSGAVIDNPVTTDERGRYSFNLVAGLYDFAVNVGLDNEYYLFEGKEISITAENAQTVELTGLSGKTIPLPGLATGVNLEIDGRGIPPSYYVFEPPSDTLILKTLELVPSNIVVARFDFISSQVTNPVKRPQDFGAICDGVTDDTNAMLSMFSSLVDNDVIDMAGCTVRITATSDNITKPSDTNNKDYGLLVLKGKKNVKIKNGKIIFSHVDWGLPVRVASIFFEDCENCTVDGVEIDNEFVVTETYVDNSKYFGVWIHNSRRCKLINSYIHDFDGICFSLTGNGDFQTVSPPTNSWGHIVSNNVFRYFQQNSTKGTGSYGYQVSNNIFINSWESCFKVSEESNQDPIYERTNFAQSFTGNVCYWEADFIAPLNYQGNPHNQHGILVQGQTDSLLIEGNVIDTSKISYTNLITSPIRLASREATNPQLVMNNIAIRGNLLVSKYLLMYINTTVARRLDISSNSMRGERVNWIGSGSVPAARNKKMTFNDNSWTLPDASTDKAYILNQRSFYDAFEFNNNSFPEDIELIFDFFNVNNFNVCNNTGKITLVINDGNNVYTKISNNELRALSINMSGTEYYVDNNTIRSNFSFPLNIEYQTETYGSVSGNTVYGESSSLAGGFLSLNANSNQASTLMAVGNSVNANIVRSYNLSSNVRVRAGELISELTTPEGSINAFKGVTCLTPNNSAASKQVWYKTSDSGSSGWKPLTLVDDGTTANVTLQSGDVLNFVNGIFTGVTPP